MANVRIWFRIIFWYLELLEKCGLKWKGISNALLHSKLAHIQVLGLVFHVDLSVAVWLFFQHSHFLPDSKDIQVRLTGNPHLCKAKRSQLSLLRLRHLPVADVDAHLSRSSFEKPVNDRGDICLVTAASFHTWCRSWEKKNKLVGRVFFFNSD